jgi:hypothetical protein
MKKVWDGIKTVLAIIGGVALGLGLYLLGRNLGGDRGSARPDFDGVGDSIDTASGDLGSALETQMRQASISATLTTLQMEHLPAISQQVRLLEDSFNDYEAKAKRDNGMLLGATIAAFIIAVLALIF